MKIYRVRDKCQQIRWVTSDDGENFYALRDELFYEEPRITNERVDVQTLLTPLQPTLLYGIGKNYPLHAKETGASLPEYPLVFLKATTSVLDPGGAICLPRQCLSNEVDFEIELAVVINAPCKNVSREEAMSYVLGYTIANDVSARDWQLDPKKSGSQWARGKSFDTFCPLGPCLVKPSDLPNPHQLTLTTKINGETFQSSSTSEMLFDIPTLIEFLSASTTLEAGTVILTGTPAGVGVARKSKRYLQPGDKIEMEIEGIGILKNTVVEEEILHKG